MRTFNIIKDDGKGENIAGDYFCLKVAAREIKLPGFCL
jgi:hypothetical protein